MLTPSVDLFPDGEPGAGRPENGVATDAYLPNLTLPETGLYRIEVRSYRDQSGGAYDLVLAEPRPLVLKRCCGTTGLAIHPDGRTALVGGGHFNVEFYDDSIQVWDLESGEVLCYLVATPRRLSTLPSARRMQALSAT
jgi:hypothetical protein